MSKMAIAGLLAVLVTLQGCSGQGKTEPKANSFHDDLTEFFHSPHGLSMSYHDAVKLADQEESYLKQCSITVPSLQSLRDVLALPSALDIGVSELRQHLFPLAYQHVAPDMLSAFFKNLAKPALGGCSQKDAQMLAIALSMKHAEPELLLPLFQVLANPKAVGLSKTDALRKAVDLTAAGTDSKQLASTYWDTVKLAGKDAALTVAIRWAVSYHLLGLPQRYAKNVEPYTAKKFQEYYGDQWLVEWQAAPQQKRTAPDGVDYLASEFYEYYASSWNQKWGASPVANQVRIAGDGKTYTMSEFKEYYTDDWQLKWASAYEVVGSPKSRDADEVVV